LILWNNDLIEPVSISGKILGVPANLQNRRAQLRIDSKGLTILTPDFLLLSCGAAAGRSLPLFAGVANLLTPKKRRPSWGKTRDAAISRNTSCNVLKQKRF
jgi:hypothetical protein